jgi:chromosome segregation ATPase
MPKNMSDRRLTTIHLKDLQVLMDEVSYDVVQQEEVRARRRKLQNRHSAKTSSARKRKQFASMTENSMQVQHELQGLRSELANLQGENMSLRMQMQQAKQREASAVRETALFRRKIGLLTQLLASGQQLPRVWQGSGEANSQMPGQMVLIPQAGATADTTVPGLQVVGSHSAPAW